ncbi:MAG TPA: PKD domain-containing protein [Planctomycetota bacterium]|nr:PKD domain-containing protein [Planctomycetota bacterium]
MSLKKLSIIFFLCALATCVSAANPPLITPDPTAAPTPTFTGINVQFTSNISGGVPPYTYAWNFADGATDTVPNPVHAFIVAGSFTVSLLVTDSANQSHTLTLQVAVAQATPLAFISPPTATPTPNVLLCYPPPCDDCDVQLPARLSATPPAGPGEPVVFSCAAAGNGALTFAWDFGDGATDTTQSPTHTYMSAGIYTATVAVTDVTNQTISGSVTVTVNAPLIGVGLDSNGNGISDDIDDLAGVCPYDPNGTPVADITAPPTPLNITKMQIRLNFTKKYRDTITLSGTLPIPAGTNLGGKVLVLILGGVYEGLSLNSNGKTLTTTGVPLAIKVKTTNGVVATAQNAQFAINLHDAYVDLAEILENGTYAEVLQPYGLVNASTSTTVKLPVTLIFNQLLFKTSVTLHYAAKAGRSGMAK